MKPIKHNLDFEKTLPYFIDHIQCDKTLSNKVIERIDFHKGVFFTLLPSNAELDRLYKFPFGGIIPPIPYGDEVYYIEGHSEPFHPQQVITMDDEFSKFIASYVNEKPGNCAIIENYMLKPDHFHTKIKNVKMIPYQNEVYYVLDKTNSLDEIYTTIRKSKEIWHSLAILTVLEDMTLSTFTNEALDNVCDLSQFVIAGAYDGEGYIFWEKNE